MAMTKEKIATMALIRLGGAPITDFTANTREAQVVSNMYDTVKESLFNYAQWNFAMQKATLAELSETIQDPNFSNVYSLPTNTVRIIGVFDSNGNYYTDYTVENNKIYTTFSGARLQYIELQTEDKFPAFFTECLVAKLAFEMAEAITGIGSVHERLFTEFNEKLRKARIADGQENPPQSIIGRGSLIDAHQGQFKVRGA
tara:strand:+ start:1150 stop:1749 length:600 start_codon:yes stop_codon:yes gene_type:complete